VGKGYMIYILSKKKSQNKCVSNKDSGRVLIIPYYV
jgi:hypothetical protein